jgi:DNA invertase Pin-like site-specific DNA recombinase
MSAPAKLHCAIYTRKSSEEGLDQEFNSLDAQREACAAYIASQAGLGWKLIPALYDDGGISGGTMEWPALQKLLQDIRDRRIDVVVVYKIDRLTRSLMDFSKIVEIFDASGISFVSVTQAFNTTSSMGRLTLNVLLSFAQFEREVTAERIRDKIAASRKKGMWMGGRVPFGYAVKDRKLVVDAQDAETVRNLFRRYIELRSVLALTDEFNRQLDDEHDTDPESEIRSKPAKWSRGKLYYLLSNQIYVGRVKHHDQHFDGEHPAIIDPDQFAEVQMLLAGQSQRRRGASPNVTDTHLLNGIVFDETGDLLSPTHAKNHGRRYRYYISSRLKSSKSKGDGGWRIPASELEGLVKYQFQDLLINQARLADWVQLYAPSDSIVSVLEKARAFDLMQPKADQRTILRSAFPRIDLSPSNISFQIDRKALVELLGVEIEITLDAGADTGSAPFTIDLPITIKRRGVETSAIIANHAQARLPDSNLVNTIARAHFYLARLTDGTVQSIADLAKQCGVHRADISRVLPLAFLSPKIVDAILTGRQPVELTSRRLARLLDLPLNWHNQEAALRS